MKRFFKYFILIALLIASCTDGKKASKATFSKALNDYFSKKPPIAGNIFIQYPSVLLSKRQMMGPDKESIEALVDAKLVEFKGDTIINGTPGKKFDASENGKKLLTKTTVMNMFLGNKELQGFVFAKEKITEVIGYSEPADMLGRKVSEVKYKSAITNVADWAKDEKIQKSFQNMKEYFSPDYNDEIKKAVFILTSDGWVHEALYSE